MLHYAGLISKSFQRQDKTMFAICPYISFNLKLINKIKWVIRRFAEPLLQCLLHRKSCHREKGIHIILLDYSEIINHALHVAAKSV